MGQPSRQTSLYVVHIIQGKMLTCSEYSRESIFRYHIHIYQVLFLFILFCWNVNQNIKEIYIRLSWRIDLNLCYLDLQVIGQSK